MANKRVLAFDFGASSGRAILGTFDGKTISLQEIHRFSNDPVNLNGTLYWDILRLYHEIKQGLIKAKLAGGFDCVGIDTWGVDFGLFDEEGRLLENPVHYRDARTEGIMEELFKVIPKEEIYENTGIQFIALNTINQLFSLAKNRPELLKRTHKLLLVPDMMVYFLTGAEHSEYTMASTTQLMNPNTGDWAYSLFDRLGIPKDIFCDIVDAGTCAGNLKEDLCKELGIPSVPVYYVAGHDTGSAVVSVPAQVDDFVYISSGTWSLMGTECEKPVINEKSLQNNFTNEGGYGRNVRLLKNIMGLWLIQESRRQWQREGFEVSFADLEREALACKPFQCFVDPDYEAFNTPGDMPNKIREYCRMTGQYVPESRGEVMRCIYESLALKYRMTFKALEDMTGHPYPCLHIVGGGTKDGLLSQFASNACGVEVITGPIEATAIGNISVQLMAMGEIADLKEARKIIASSFEQKKYEPKDVDAWNEAAARFAQVIKG